MSIDNIILLVGDNLEKASIGFILFLCSYLANMGLGAWKKVKIDGNIFDWKLILQSGLKFIALGFSIGLLSCVISTIPAYAMYIGIDIADETLNTMNGLVIVSAFLTATIRYTSEAIDKLKTILDSKKE